MWVTVVHLIKRLNNLVLSYLITRFSVVGLPLHDSDNCWFSVYNFSIIGLSLCAEIVFCIRTAIKSEQTREFHCRMGVE